MPSSTSPVASIPPLQLPGLHRSDALLNATDASIDAVYPEEMAAVLTDAGVIGVQERTYVGGRGAFARVVVRAWVFSSADGATTFLDWLHTKGSELIGESKTVAVAMPAGVSLALHTPSGCCHEEVPIYLGSWQRDATVWSILASGPKIHTAPVVSLVRSLEGEV